ncbi:MAG: hypothetical protein JW915_15070, partial [Chitinispirillaceae bacterium]|nr:hypothetical protein [Chitinispirillaceae bacterium]
MPKLTLFVLLLACGITYASDPVSIRFNQPLRGEVTPSVDVDQFYFTGTAGDKITIRLDPDGNDVSFSDDPDSRFQLLAPDNSVLIDQNVTECLLNAVEDFELPSNGTYTIRVMETEGNQTFPYSIALYSNLDTRINAPAIPFGVPVRDTISTTVEQEFHLFTGTAGDKITIRLDPDGNDVSFSDDPDSR